MKNWNGTKGEWYERDRNIQNKEILITHQVFDKYDRLLIIDAGNTIQKCDLLPSELLNQNEELLSMLERVSVIQYENYGNGMNTHLKMSGISSELNELINRINPNK